MVLLRSTDPIEISPQRPRTLTAPGSEKGTASSDQSHSPDTEDVVETLNLLAAAATTHPALGASAAGLSMEIPEPKINSHGRFPCPFANVYGCKTTLVDERGAMRHAKTHLKTRTGVAQATTIHSTDFVCAVCQKKLSQRDKLAAHIKLHTPSEIESASKKNHETRRGQDEAEENHDTHMQDVETGLDEQQEGGSTEYATPNEEDILPEVSTGAADLVDFEMMEAEPINDARGDISDSGSTGPTSVFDKEETIVKETPMPTGGLKRKRAREATTEANPRSPERARKRNKASMISPPTSLPPKDLTKHVTPKVSSVTAAARSRQNTEKIVPQLRTKRGSLDGWAQKFTAGSNLKHPHLNPTPTSP